MSKEAWKYSSWKFKAIGRMSNEVWLYEIGQLADNPLRQEKIFQLL